MRGQTVDCIRIRKPGNTSTQKKTLSEATSSSEDMNDEIPF
jgi:hypothetical protein